MSEHESGTVFHPTQYRLALSRWDNEGGAVCDDVPAGTSSRVSPSASRTLTNVELVQLHIRVIALENLVVALLADASERQLGYVREMAARIAPEPNFTQHPLTIRAATQMTNLMRKARRR
jgi:hypothetical protein